MSSIQERTYDARLAREVVHCIKDKDWAEVTDNEARALVAHIDALEERCAAYKGQVEAGAKRIDTLESELASEKARVAELEGALTNLADEADRIGNILSAHGQGATVLGMRTREARAALERGEG